MDCPKQRNIAQDCAATSNTSRASAWLLSCILR
ncbi:hypothetical protein T11_3837 [Trichinella zimbabwensis]|uniref:Uncharacterized protein n=1 Tax=Trichinella zimbabwensis TaxID=268475 RepID=A0A0V1GD05_9BILA|nr:hypothetical protein T11_3837 [Trichinella zimbabwensis]